MPDIVGLVAELRDEGDELVDLIGGLSTPDWARGTPAPGWDISAQVAHLTVVDERALASVTDPRAFLSVRTRDRTDHLLTAATESCRELPPARLLATFLDVRARFLEAAEAADPATRVAWYGPDMSLASMVTARLMETWAHGQDIRDALGSRPSLSGRLRHIARLGVATRAYSFAAHGLPPSTEPVAVSLTAPDGETWVYGETGARYQVRGPALDFCLLVTRRRHVADTALIATPGPAAEWLLIAQAFAGPPGKGRRPGQFAAPP